MQITADSFVEMTTNPSHAAISRLNGRAVLPYLFAPKQASDLVDAVRFVLGFLPNEPNGPPRQAPGLTHPLFGWPAVEVNYENVGSSYRTVDAVQGAEGIPQIPKCCLYERYAFTVAFSPSTVA